MIAQIYFRYVQRIKKFDVDRFLFPRGCDKINIMYCNYYNLHTAKEAVLWKLKKIR